MKFTIKKVLVSEEEKIDWAEFFVGDTGQYVDVEAFVKQDIYEEFIDYKCLSCKYEDELEADIVLEMFYPEFEEYPLLTCPKCGKDKFVPLDIYKAKIKKQAFYNKYFCKILI